MADELLDLVNKEDEVIGKIMKRDHTSVIHAYKNKQDTGQYVSAIGGHVKSGESCVQALKREAKEEYGLSGNFKFKLIGKKIYNRTVKGNRENHYFIIYEIYTSKKPILDEESVSYKEFSERDLSKELKSHPKKFGPPFLFLINTFYPNLTLKRP